MSEIKIRPATEADAPFVAQCVRLAESQGSGAVSYQRIFDLSDDETEKLLLDLAAEEAEGQELTFENFLLIEVDGQVAGGCAAWIEAHDNPPSNSIKATLLTHYLSLECFKAATERLQALNKVGIDRTKGALQIDAIAVFDGFRGQGLVRKLIDAQLYKFTVEQSNVELAEIICMNTNTAAIRAYEKAGFTLTKQTEAEDADLSRMLQHILGGTGKRCYEKQIHN